MLRLAQSCSTELCNLQCFFFSFLFVGCALALLLCADESNGLTCSYVLYITILLFLLLLLVVVLLLVLLLLLY